MNILVVRGLEILDSRGNPTLWTKIVLEDGSIGEFEVPSGASTGVHEAHELRDGTEAFNGKGVSKAVENVERIAQQIEGKSFSQKELDDYLIQLDGTNNKEFLGANAILGVSVAFAKAMAQYYQLPLHEYLHRIVYDKKFSLKTHQKKPQVTPFANVVNGGLHSGNGLQVQEFMLVPNLGDFYKNTQAIAETYQNLKTLISKQYGSEATGLGDEGGFAPPISTPEEALDLLQEASKNAGYENEMFFAIDAAATDFYDEKSQKYEIIKGKFYDYKQLTSYYNSLLEKYNLISIEDPMAEDDFKGFSYFMKHVSNLGYTNPVTQSKKPLVVGDDLLVTNPQRIKTAKSKKLCNALLLKINQIGTLTQSIEAFSLADNAGWHTTVSHRSGETTDTFIADLAYALSSSIKLGAPARGERVAKYNRLLKIYQQ